MIFARNIIETINRDCNSISIFIWSSPLLIGSTFIFNQKYPNSKFKIEIIQIIQFLSDGIISLH